MSKKFILFGLILLLWQSLLACASEPATQGTSSSTSVSNSTSQDEITLSLGAYTTPREAYAKILPLFQTQWKDAKNQNVTFEESYLGSGAQARAIVEGFEADIAALSLEADINKIVDSKLITNDWKAVQNRGIVSTSVVSFAVRKGNPKGIKDWADLAKPGVEILTPNPKTSGGAMWNILALYGAAKFGGIEGVPANDDAAAQAFLLSVLNNVTVMDKGARESITNFEQGIGDVAITYENEVKVGQKNGFDYELIIPNATILIENPVAVVDVYADKHGVRDVAQEFVNFLFTKEAQEIFAEYGLRSVESSVAKATEAEYAPVSQLFTIEDFGGWSKATPEFFGTDGIYTKIVAQVQPLADQ